jgi:hypothetical protein
MVEKAVTNSNGLSLTLYAGGRALKVERSLPKLYRGQNIDDLAGPAVAVSLAMLDAEIGETLGTYDLPSVAEWLPVRVDYPRTMHLEDDGAVLRTLDKWAGIEMPYKGLPVVGQSHSVAWTKGDIRLKAYSKRAESRDARAAGMLRVEPGVFRARTFRKLLGLASDAAVTLLDVLTPVLHQTVHDRFADRLKGGLTVKELRDMDLAREMVALFGARRTATLLGWAVMFALWGVESRADMLAVNLASVPTRYRVLADFRQLRDHLVDLGYSLSEAGDPESDVEMVIHTVAAAA